MKSSALTFAALLLCTTTPDAQVAPPPTPVVPCDGHAIRGARSIPDLTIPTRSGSSSTELRQTSVSISYENGAAHFFVSDTQVPLARLGQTAADAWSANSGGATIDQCWDERAVGQYSVGGRMTTICTIVVRADDGVRYGDLSSARNALRAVGFTKFALMRSSQSESAVFFDYHLPLNPVPILLQGVSPTMVRIMSPPDATEPVIGIVNGRGWTAVPFAQLGESLTSAVARNNPALAANEMNTEARICVRPDSIISYGDVLRVITAIRDQGFRRVGLYSEAVVPVDDQGRQLPLQPSASAPGAMTEPSPSHE